MGLASFIGYPAGCILSADCFLSFFLSFLFGDTRIWWTKSIAGTVSSFFLLDSFDIFGYLRIIQWPGSLLHILCGKTATFLGTVSCCFFYPVSVGLGSGFGFRACFWLLLASFCSSLVYWKILIDTSVFLSVLCRNVGFHSYFLMSLPFIRLLPVLSYRYTIPPPPPSPLLLSSPCVYPFFSICGSNC